jgi:hypothetical protein
MEVEEIGMDLAQSSPMGAAEEIIDISPYIERLTSITFNCKFCGFLGIRSMIQSHIFSKHQNKLGIN